MPAREQRDRAIVDGLGGFEPEFQRALDFLVLLSLRDPIQSLEIAVAPQFPCFRIRHP